MMNVLVLAAHPDDEVLGCGGTIARLAEEGHAVHILILGEGITSRSTTPHEADAGMLDQLYREATAVGSFLGAKSVELAKFPDNRFDTVPLLDIVKRVEALIEHVRPEIVYTQHGGDLNIDHTITFRAALTATRPMRGNTVRTVYAFPVASSTEWSFQHFSSAFHPTSFMDISRTLEKKIAAMELYESERRPFPHPRSSEALRAAALHWGGVAGLSAAEPFELVRDIR